MIRSQAKTSLLLALAAVTMLDLSVGLTASSTSAPWPLAADWNVRLVAQLPPTGEQAVDDGLYNASASQNATLSLSHGTKFDDDCEAVGAVGSAAEDSFNSSVVVVDGVELPMELAELIASASRTASPEEFRIRKEGSESTLDVRYYPSSSDGGELCSSKSSSSFDNTDESYATLQDCCATVYFFDFDACMEGAASQEDSAQRQTESESIEARYYYPTYTEGELCSSKPSSAFEIWEESYASLRDCCEDAFSWDLDACMRS